MTNAAQSLIARKIFSVQALVYIRKAPLSGGTCNAECFAILAKGRCFFGPSAKGLRSFRSLNLLQRNTGASSPEKLRYNTRGAKQASSNMPHHGEMGKRGFSITKRKYNEARFIKQTSSRRNNETMQGEGVAQVIKYKW
jgi:hypothetical protein